VSMSSFAVLALVFSVAGCVAVAPAGESASPAVSPTPGVTTMAPPTQAPATPSAPPTSPPPTASATAEPTATPPPETDTPQPTAGLGFDERDLLFQDDMSDPASGWGVGDTGGGSTAYVDGALQLDTNSDGAWMWSHRATGRVNGTLRVAGAFVVALDGTFGLMCSSGDEDLIGAVVDTAGGWSFVTSGAEGATELVGNPDAGLDIPMSEQIPVVLECAGLASGRLRMQLWLANGLVGIHESEDGPENFDGAAVYVQSDSDDFSVRAEQVFAFGVTGADGQPNADGLDLLSHVPAAWRDLCYQSPVPPPGGGLASANLACFLGRLGDEGAEVVEYAAYPSKQDMDAAYQGRVDNFGTGDGAASCAQGSGERAYTIDDVASGRVLCVPQVVGIRFDWTDDRLNILSSLVDLDGSHSLTFQDWAAGGPNV